MKQRVLVVDDSPVIRALESYILKANGYSVETASNGIEALEKLYSGEFELMVVDINMPKMDGIQLIKAVREQELYMNIPIIIVTSEEEEEDRRKGIEAGANIYLIKPTQPDTLVTNVKMLIGA